MGAIKIKDKRDRVWFYLENHPHLRDSDNKLIAMYWRDELRKLGFEPNSISAMSMLKLIAEGKVSNAQSITRAARKLRADFDHLQGKEYKARKNNEENIKDDLDSFYE